MSQRSDGSVVIEARVDNAPLKKDLAQTEKDVASSGKSVAKSFSESANSAALASKSVGSLQSSVANLAATYARSGRAATENITSITRQTSEVAKQALAYNAVTRAAQEATLAERDAAIGQVDSLNSRLQSLTKQITVKQSTLNEINSDPYLKGSLEAQEAKVRIEKEVAALQKESGTITKQLATANDVLAVSTGKVEEAFKKQVGVLPAIKSGFAGLLRVLGGGLGIAITAVTAGLAYFTGSLGKGKKENEAFSISLSGIYGGAEEARKGVNSLRQEISRMGREQAKFRLEKVEEELTKLTQKLEAARKIAYEASDMDIEFSIENNVLNDAIDDLVALRINAKEFEDALYAARAAKLIDEKEFTALKKLGEQLVEARENFTALSEKAAGAGSSVGQALREIDEAAKPQNLKDAYTIFNRYIDSQDKGKKTATDAAKQAAKLAVERMKEAAASESAASASLNLAAAQEKTKGNEKRAEELSKFAQDALNNAARLFSDAAKLEAKIPDIKVSDGSGGSSSAKKLGDVIKDIRREIAELNRVDTGSFAANLRKGLDDIEKKFEGVKGASEGVVDSIKKEFSQAFAVNSLQEMTREIMELEGRASDLAAIDIDSKVKSYGDALRDSGEPADEAAASIARYRELLERKIDTENLEEQLSFLRDLSQLTGDYGLSIEKQNELISRRADTMRAEMPQLKEYIDLWEKLQKREASQEWEDGFSRSADKFTAEWTNAAKIAEKTFDTLVGGVQSIGTAAVDAIFGDAEFRADKLLKDIAKQMLQLAFNAAIGGAFKGIFEVGFSQGGYTGDTPSNQVAGVVHGQEFVVNAKTTKSLGVDTLNAINSSGSLSSLYSRMSLPARPVPVAARDGGTTVQIIDKRSTKSEPVQVQETRSADGSRQITAIIEDTVVSNLNRNGSIYKTIGTKFDVAPAKRGY